mmetsp:Transcript_29330/g.86897  ORF Transcript_29330/g.86897 Transcript_29330/m.86897 type:complete len:627 (-) Transcript_29330:926-2806(-)
MTNRRRILTIPHRLPCIVAVPGTGGRSNRMAGWIGGIGLALGAQKNPSEEKRERELEEEDEEDEKDKKAEEQQQGCEPDGEDEGAREPEESKDGSCDDDEATAARGATPGHEEGEEVTLEQLSAAASRNDSDGELSRGSAVGSGDAEEEEVDEGRNGDAAAQGKPRAEEEDSIERQLSAPCEDKGAVEHEWAEDEDEHEEESGTEQQLSAPGEVGGAVEHEEAEGEDENKEEEAAHRPSADGDVEETVVEPEETKDEQRKGDRGDVALALEVGRDGFKLERMEEGQLTTTAPVEDASEEDMAPFAALASVPSPPFVATERGVGESAAAAVDKDGNDRGSEALLLDEFAVAFAKARVVLGVASAATAQVTQPRALGDACAGADADDESVASLETATSAGASWYVSPCVTVDSQDDQDDHIQDKTESWDHDGSENAKPKDNDRERREAFAAARAAVDALSKAERRGGPLALSERGAASAGPSSSIVSNATREKAGLISGREEATVDPVAAATSSSSRSIAADAPRGSFVSVSVAVLNDSPAREEDESRGRGRGKRAVIIDDASTGVGQGEAVISAANTSSSSSSNSPKRKSNSNEAGVMDFATVLELLKQEAQREMGRAKAEADRGGN